MNSYWVGLQLDRCVTWFGRHVESKLMETDPVSKRQLYTLDGLLADQTQKPTRAKLREMATMSGGGIRYRRSADDG